MATKWMKQGNATAEFKGVALHRNAHRLPKVKARKSDRHAPALPAFTGRKRRYDIAHVGNLFRP
jgi:hypothetical protein